MHQTVKGRHKFRDLLANQSLFSPERPSTLTNWVRQTLEESILLGDLSPGERLLEENLSKVFFVSRTPVREALRQLEREGLVDSIPRRGFFVRKMRPEDVEEALLIQARLLPLATRLSVDFVEESDLYFLLGCLDQMEAMALGGDVRGYLLQNQRLISRLLELSRRPQLIKMTERLIKQFLRYEAHLLSITGEMEKMVEGMRSVVDALSARDGDGAERAFQGLIEQTIQSVKSDEYQRIAEQWEKGERTFGDMQITETLEPIAEERIKE